MSWPFSQQTEKKKILLVYKLIQFALHIKCLPEVRKCFKLKGNISKIPALNFIFLDLEYCQGDPLTSLSWLVFSIFGITSGAI